MAPDTLEMYRQKAGTLTRIIGGDTRLASIDGATFAAYIDARRDDYRESTGKVIAESTLYKEWVTFRGIIKQAWRASKYGRDPASLKPPHFGPDYHPRETALTWPQVTMLLDALPEVRRKPTAFAIAFGARRREVFRALAGDIGTETVRIRGTKTDIADAVLPITSLMAGPALIAADPPYAPWPNARRDLAAACVHLGIPRVTWNDLRRTFASLLVQSGVAPHLVAKLLRHKTTAMVDRVYGRQTTESLAHLIEAQIREPLVNHKPQG